MKKNILFIMCFICALCMIGCATVAESQNSTRTSQRPTTTDDLDDVIRAASNYLNSNLPDGSKIVILNIHSDS